MGLLDLKIQDFRNITHAEIPFTNKLTIFYGRNGSGKTSVLEAIHYLGVGRSFRTHKSHQLIRHEQDQLIVHAQVSVDERVISVGIRKSKEQLEIKRNGTHLSSIADIAMDLPIVVINPDIHQIIEGSPKCRRRFLDWGVFHVEHQFSNLWKSYNHVLKQRNAALKRRWDISTIQTFDSQFFELSILITKMREDYLASLQIVLNELLRDHFSEFDLSLRFRRGWSSSKTLDEVLKDNWESDCQNGFTGSGPHKADILVLIKNMPAKEVVSRGQQKIVSSLMRLAQIQLLKNHGKQVTLLIDDMAAELDAQYHFRLLQGFMSTDSQILLTTTERELLPETINKGEATVFHVEHGLIQQRA